MENQNQQFDYAYEQFNDSCRLFLDKHYKSALTLAGAAEEIWGKLIEKNNKSSTKNTNAYEDLKLFLIKSYEEKKREKPCKYFLNDVHDVLNGPRNFAKHFMGDQSGKIKNTFNSRNYILELLEKEPAECAESMICRALLNYYKFLGRLPDSKEFRQFLSKHIRLNKE